MKRNCNLELRLLPPSVSFNSSNYDTQHHSMLDTLNNGSSSLSIMQQQEQQQNQMTIFYKGQTQQQEQQQNQMTIFYKGQTAVTDVTELQAKAIILLANREMEGRLTSSPMNYSSSSSTPRSPLMQQLHAPSPTGLSMKRSLQRFLQKRKTRAQAASPYHH